MLSSLISTRVEMSDSSKFWKLNSHLGKSHYANRVGADLIINYWIHCTLINPLVGCYQFQYSFRQPRNAPMFDRQLRVDISSLLLLKNSLIISPAHTSVVLTFWTAICSFLIQLFFKIYVHQIANCSKQSSAECRRTCLCVSFGNRIVSSA